MKELSDEEIAELLARLGVSKIPVGVFYTGDSITPEYGSDSFDFLMASTLYGFIPGIYFSKDLDGSELNLNYSLQAVGGALHERYSCEASRVLSGYTYAFRQLVAFMLGSLVGGIMSYCIPRRVALHTELGGPCYGRCEIINKCYMDAGAYFMLGLLAGFNSGFGMLLKEFGGDVTQLFPEHIGAVSSFIVGILEAGKRYSDLSMNPDIRNPLMAAHLLDLLGKEGDEGDNL